MNKYYIDGQSENLYSFVKIEEREILKNRVATIVERESLVGTN